MAARILSFRYAALAAGLIVSLAAAASDDQEFLRFLAQKARQVEAEEVVPGDFTPVPSAQDEAAANTIADKVRRDQQARFGPAKGKYDQFRTLVFISLGMPERTLSALFKQAAGDPSIGLVLRGTSSPRIDRDMKRIQAMMPGEEQAVVFIDPLLFRDYHVKKVPFTLHKARDTRWYGVWGTIAISGARDLVERGQGGRNRPAVGEVYPITEPDMHETMRAKFASADWEKIRGGAEKRLADTVLRDEELPAAPRDRIRLVDVSSALVQDVLTPDGRVFAKAGTRINPLEFVTLDEAIIVFDPTNRFDNRIVTEWRRRRPAVILVATHWSPLLQSKFDQTVYVLDTGLRDRFDIEYSPSLIEQVGKHMRVTEVRPRP